jgi:fatty-acyl-CoA synthase
VSSVTRPQIAGLSDLRTIENTPYADRVPCRSTAQLLEYAATTYGSATALYFQESVNIEQAPLTWSFQAFRDRCVQAANLLRSLGIQKGDTVALLVPHIPSALFALWGAQMAGCAFPINYLLNAEHIAELLRKTKTRVVVTLGPCNDLAINAEAHRAATLAGCVEHVLEIDPDESHPAAGSLQYLMRSQPTDGNYDAELTADRTAALFHTGGTTGLPKILRHSHGNEVHTSWFGALYYDMKPGDRILNGFPIFHVAGTFVYGLAPLAAGASLFLPTLTGMRNQAFVRQIWAFADRHQLTHLGCVPTVLSALLDVPRKADQARCIRWALTGGSPLPVELAQTFENTCDIAIRSIFGMTECAGLVSIEPCKAPRHPGSVGIRLPYSEVAAIPLEAATHNRLTTFCKPGETGIVVIRGPHVSQGYLDDAQNKGTFTEDNWLISGDLGHVDEEGYIYLTGRSKDLIIRSGHNIDPGLIEEAFMKLQAVSTCAAVGEPDGYAGELPVAFVTLKEGMQTSPAQLLADVTPHIAERPAVPKRILILDKMPTTPVGKIYKPALRALAAQAKIADMIDRMNLSAAVAVDCTAESRGVVASLKLAVQLTATEREALQQSLKSLPIQINYEEMA